jgi:hypothetical protein
MIDKHLIKDLVFEAFKFVGSVQITVEEDGVVNVRGGLQMRKNKFDQIPVQFGTVTGSFEVTSVGIQSLDGCPRMVKGSFSCMGCDLTSLEGGPEQVEGFYEAQHNRLTNLKGCAIRVTNMLNVTHNPLTSLEGLTPGVSHIKVTYDEKLPLLRLLDLPGGFQIPDADQAPWDYSEPPWEKILEPYSAEGKKQALKAAAELIRAGYKSNARW